MLWLFVAVRVLANPVSNVFQKILTGRGADAVFVIGVAHALMSAGCVPFLQVLGGRPAAFWLNVSLCAVLAVAGNVLIVRALELSDLSVLGPINAYKAVVSLVPALVLLREVPGWLALAGIGLIVAGSYGLVDRTAAAVPATAFGRLLGDRGVRYRFGGLVLSAVEAVFLKRALIASSPQATFVAWAVLGFVVSAAAAVVWAGPSGGRGQVAAARSAAPTYLLLALTTALMQYTTLVAFAGLQVGPALALFQLSSVVSVLLGWRVFRERDVARRLAASAVMAVGAGLIVAGRG